MVYCPTSDPPALVRSVTLNLEPTINLPHHCRHRLGVLAVSASYLGLLGACGSTPQSAATSPAPTTTAPARTSPAGATEPSAPPGGTRPAITTRSTPSTTVSAGTPDQAHAAATKACTTWAVGTQKSAAEGSPDLKSAATQAAAAARLDRQWTTLADDMAFLSSRPLTDNTPEDVARGQIAEPAVDTTCKTLGVAMGT
jgi:hypothetical protein